MFTKIGYFSPKDDVVWVDDQSDDNERDGFHSMEEHPVSATWQGLKCAYFFLKGESPSSQSYQDQLLPFYKEEGERLFGHKT